MERKIRHNIKKKVNMNNVLVYSETWRNFTSEPCEPFPEAAHSVLLSPMDKNFRGKLPVMSDSCADALCCVIPKINAPCRLRVLVNCDGFESREAASELALACFDKNNFGTVNLTLGEHTDAFISKYATHERVVNIIVAQDRIRFLRAALDAAKVCEIITVNLAVERFGSRKPDYGVLEEKLREQFRGFVHDGVRFRSVDPMTAAAPNAHGLVALVRAFTVTPNRCVAFKSGSIVTSDAFRALQNFTEIRATDTRFSWCSSAPVLFANLTEIYLNDCEMPVKLITDVLRSAPKLESITLFCKARRAPMISLDAILHLLVSLPSRETIHTIRASYLRVADELLFIETFARFPNLREFDLTWPEESAVAPETLCALVEQAPPFLKSLAIADTVTATHSPDFEALVRNNVASAALGRKVFNALLRSRSTPDLDWHDFGIDVASMRTAKQRMMASFGLGFSQKAKTNNAFVRFARRDGDHAICTRVAQWVIPTTLPF